MMTISDEVFRDALDVALKGQGIKVKDRKKQIDDYLCYPKIDRDNILEHEEQITRSHQSAKKASKKVVSEFEEQCNFVHWFKKTYPGVVIMSIRNGGSRTPRERVDQMREGLHPGAADLYVPKYKLWIEFKKVKGGVVSREQLDFAAYVRNECGDYYFIADGCEQGKMKTIEFIGFIENPKDKWGNDKFVEKR